MRVLRAAGDRAEREVPFAGLLQLLRPVLDRWTPSRAAGRGARAALALQAGARPGTGSRSVPRLSLL